MGSGLRSWQKCGGYGKSRSWHCLHSRPGKGVLTFAELGNLVTMAGITGIRGGQQRFNHIGIIHMSGAMADSTVNDWSHPALPPLFNYTRGFILMAGNAFAVLSLN